MTGLFSTINRKSKARQQGFTLIELVMVIVLLGVVSVGVSGLIKLTSQTFVNVSSRDELISSARFAVERLNREIRDALPNSIRVASNTSMQCLEFAPIVASTTYLDIPVAPEVASNSLSVVEFFDQQGEKYSCNGSCSDAVTVYPLSSTDVYIDNLATATSGKTFAMKSDGLDTSGGDLWQITLANNVLFANDATTQRLYLISKPVSYCVTATGELTRYSNYNFTASQQLPPIAPNNQISANTALMAQYLNNIALGQVAFTVNEATLHRNALVEIALYFEKFGEQIVFNNQMRIRNVP